MWIMTTYGAFSVVARDPKHMKPGDEATMVVRARPKVWLTELRKRAMPELGPSQHFPGADYLWHAAVRPEDLARGVARIALDARRYRNFKNATMDPKFGLRTAKLRNSLHNAYTKIWGALLDAGDGRSAYDLKWKTGKHAAGSICQRLGHYDPKHTGTCQDCGEKIPAPKLAESAPAPHMIP